jgi:hypothetical protein
LVGRTLVAFGVQSLRVLVEQFQLEPTALALELAHGMRPYGALDPRRAPALTREPVYDLQKIARERDGGFCFARRRGKDLSDASAANQGVPLCEAEQSQDVFGGRAFAGSLLGVKRQLL